MCIQHILSANLLINQCWTHIPSQSGLLQICVQHRLLARYALSLLGSSSPDGWDLVLKNGAQQTCGSICNRSGWLCFVRSAPFGIPGLWTRSHPSYKLEPSTCKHASPQTWCTNGAEHTKHCQPGLLQCLRITEVSSSMRTQIQGHKVKFIGLFTPRFCYGLLND